MPPPTVASETLLYEDRSGRVTAGCSCASLFPWMGRMLPRRYRDPVALLASQAPDLARGAAINSSSGGSGARTGQTDQAECRRMQAITGRRPIAPPWGQATSGGRLGFARDNVS
jgi:hypothetical protein